MEHTLEKLAQLNLSDESRKKLSDLIVIGKKTGKISSKQLVETLDAAEATEDQIDRVYDLLESSGIEIDVTDVMELFTPDALEKEALPSDSELQSLE